MTEKEKKFLSDISSSIELIEDFTKDLKSSGAAKERVNKKIGG